MTDAERAVELINSGYLSMAARDELYLMVYRLERENDTAAKMLREMGVGRARDLCEARSEGFVWMPIAMPPTRDDCTAQGCVAAWDVNNGFCVMGLGNCLKSRFVSHWARCPGRPTKETQVSGWKNETEKPMLRMHDEI